MEKGTVVVCDGYRGDGQARALVVEKEWEAKNGKKLLTALCLQRHQYRAYEVDLIQNLRRSKT